MIVLDTHAFLWWLDGGPLLSGPARKAIAAEDPDGEIVVSSFSVWELAMLVRHRRIGLNVDIRVWLEKAADLQFVRFAPVDNEVAILSVNLPGAFHRDPADRFIVATALRLNAPLVTRDQRIRAYTNVRTIW